MQAVDAIRSFVSHNENSNVTMLLSSFPAIQENLGAEGTALEVARVKPI
jgi:hypothetical protein